MAKRRIHGLVLGALLCFASVIGAEEHPEILFNKGVQAFRAEEYPAALGWFDRAVAAKPDDVSYLYYRGTTRGYLKDYPGAIADLEACVAKKPEQKQCALELGVALVESGRNAEAIPWLEQAQQMPLLAAKASFYLGVAQLQLDRPSSAIANFNRASEDPTLATSARYYRGVAEYRMYDWEPAREDLSFVASTSPDSAIGREASAVLAKMTESGVAGQKRRYELHAAVNIQYDTNVGIAPSDELLDQQFGLGDQSDGRFTFLVGGSYSVWKVEHAELTLGYDFFQSLHFRLTEFNLQDNRPNLRLLVDYDPVERGLAAAYDYYLLETSSFLQQVTVAPWVGFDEGAYGSTDVGYRMLGRFFYPTDFSEQLDAYNHSLGIRQVYFLGPPNSYLIAGYQHVWNNPTEATGDAFGYDANQVQAGIGWQLPWAVGVEGMYLYRHENYDPASLGRRDNQQQFVFTARRPIDERFAIVAAYLGTWNNSNEDLFTYRRQIGSIGVEARF